MKKKYSFSSKDKKDWEFFTKNIGSLENKDLNIEEQQNINNKIRKLDLHGVALDQANLMVKNLSLKSL